MLHSEEKLATRIELERKYKQVCRSPAHIKGLRIYTVFVFYFYMLTRLTDKEQSPTILFCTHDNCPIYCLIIYIVPQVQL